MSQVYVTEPPCNGKVLLHTSIGDLDIELWSKEAPKAVRNFVQLCLEGYYDGNIFHRIIKGFMAQTGDPTGTGEGGESIYGQPFPDEIHSRLRFGRRGLVAMANAGPNENRSQFFITFDRAEHLNKKHTIFGKVSGDTVFNLFRLEEAEVDKNDRPIYPPKIQSVEVLNSPFDDIIPRDLKKRTTQSEVKPKTKEKTKKNLSLLSFGTEAEEEEQALKQFDTKIKSSHDVLTDDPRLSREVAVVVDEAKLRAAKESEKEKEQKLEQVKKQARQEASDSDDDDDDDDELDTFQSKMRDQIKRKEEASKQNESSTAKRTKIDDEVEARLLGKSSVRLDNVKKEIQDVKRDILRFKRTAAEAPRQLNLADAILSPLEEMRQKYKKNIKRNEAKDREEQTLAALEGFFDKIRGAEKAPEPEKPQIRCTLHSLLDCKSCMDTFGVVDKSDDRGWLAHQLVFPKQAKDANLRNDDINDLMVLDPRLAGNKELIHQHDQKQQQRDIDRRKGLSTNSRDDGNNRKRPNDDNRDQGDRDRDSKRSQRSDDRDHDRNRDRDS